MTSATKTKKTVGWAQKHEGKWEVAIDGDAVQITDNFAARINAANMGDVVRGRTVDGLIEVKIRPRFN